MRMVLGLLTVAAACTPAQANAQLISERLDGMQRVCTYSGSTGLLTGTDRIRQHRVGLAQNCPGTLPNLPGLPMPPTAQLQAQYTSGGSRVCVFEQAGGSWQRSIPISRACPLWAGGLIAERGAGR